MVSKARPKRGADARRNDVADEKRLLTTIQVADMLACDRSTVYRLVSAGKLKSRKIGRLTRFRPEDVQKFIDGGRR